MGPVHSGPEKQEIEATEVEEESGGFHFLEVHLPSAGGVLVVICVALAAGFALRWYLKRRSKKVKIKDEESAVRHTVDPPVSKIVEMNYSNPMVRAAAAAQMGYYPPPAYPPYADVRPQPRQIDYVDEIAEHHRHQRRDRRAARLQRQYDEDRFEDAPGPGAGGAAPPPVGVPDPEAAQAAAMARGAEDYRNIR